MIALMICVSPTRAEWGRTADDYIALRIGDRSVICSDLNGGCWIAANPVGLCHIDRLGNVTWGDQFLYFEPVINYNPKIVPVDTASVIVAMQRYEDEDSKVYLNRINTERELLWGENGIPLANTDANQPLFDVFPGPVPNTFLIHWAGRNRSLQLINSDGEMLWDVDAISLPMWSENSKILTTSDNCIIAAHPVDRYPRQNPLVEVLKFNADGEQLWQRRYAITGEEPILRGWELSDVESDRDGGVILSTKYKRWESLDDSLRYFSLGIMRISSDGDSMWTHKVYERLVEPINPHSPRSIIDPLGQCEFILNHAGLGHFFASWVDNLRHSDDDPFKVISFDEDFELHWDEPLDVIISPDGYGSVDVIDSDSSVCYVWRDRDPDRENSIIQQWGQRIGVNGERLWDDRGRIIQNHGIWRQSATTDGNGGVITIVEFVFPAVQMMNRNGEIGVVLDPVGVSDDFDFVGQINHPAKLSIYPNPGNSYLNVELSPVFPNEAFNYRIYDIIGRSVTTGTIRDFPYLVKDIARFSSGEYVLWLQSRRTTVSTRFFLIK